MSPLALLLVVLLVLLLAGGGWGLQAGWYPATGPYSILGLLLLVVLIVLLVRALGLL